MSRTIKLKNDDYLDSAAIIHKRKKLKEILSIENSVIESNSNVSTISQNYIKKFGNIVDIYYRGIVASPFSGADKIIGIIPIGFRPSATLVLSNALSTGTNEWSYMNNGYVYLDSNSGNIACKGTGTFFQFHITYLID